VKEFKKKIRIELLEEADRYFDTLNDKIKSKFFVSFDKTQIGLKGSWFKSIGSDIWEFKQRDHQKFYRIFAFWDSTEATETLILATSGFDKKTKKTPKAQIERAKRIRRKYFENKKNIKG